MNYLEKVGIHEIIGAPFVGYHQGMKEETYKYLVSRYLHGKLLLDQPYSISNTTIHLIIGLPYKEPKVSIIGGMTHWLRKLSRGVSGKN